MSGRPCLICKSTANAKIAAEMVAAGASDAKIAAATGVSRPAAARHRVNHIMAPAKAIVEAANKGLGVRQEREARIAAAESDQVTAFVSLAGVVSDLKSVRDRLERSAEAAEQAGQHPIIAQIASQQHKSVEIRSKLGSVGGYAPPKAGAVNLPTFAVTFHFSGSRTEQIIAAPIIDALPDDSPLARSDEDDAPIEDV